jgi:hypothetical protein
MPPKKKAPKKKNLITLDTSYVKNASKALYGPDRVQVFGAQKSRRPYAWIQGAISARANNNPVVQQMIGNDIVLDPTGQFARPISLEERMTEVEARRQEKAKWPDVEMEQAPPVRDRNFLNDILAERQRQERENRVYEEAEAGPVETPLDDSLDAVLDAADEDEEGPPPARGPQGSSGEASAMESEAAPVVAPTDPSMLRSYQDAAMQADLAQQYASEAAAAQESRSAAMWDAVSGPALPDIDLDLLLEDDDLVLPMPPAVPPAEPAPAPELTPEAQEATQQLGGQPVDVAPQASNVNMPRGETVAPRRVVRQRSNFYAPAPQFVPGRYEPQVSLEEPRTWGPRRTYYGPHLPRASSLAPVAPVTPLSRKRTLPQQDRRHRLIYQDDE